MKYLLFIVAICTGISIGGMLAALIFFGLLTFIGFVGLVESVPLLRWIFYRTSQVFDVVIFVATIAATVKLGVTITASLTVAGLAVTFLYRPYIENKKRIAKKNSNNHSKYKL